MGEAWKQAFDGPTMLAVRAAALRPDAVGVRLAARVSVERDEFFNRLASALPPAIVLPFAAEPLIEVTHSGEVAIVRMTQAPYLSLYVTVRNGMAFGDTSLPLVNEFAREGKAAEPFTEGPDHGRVVQLIGGGAGGSPDVLAYLNVRPLIPLAAAAEEELPEVIETLGLSSLEFAAVTADWSGAEAVVRAGVGVSDDQAAFLRFVSPASRRLEGVATLPANFMFAAGGAMTSAAEGMDEFCKLLERVDPDIVTEYRAELAEAASEFGFDPHRDFLGNFVDEWALGVTPTADGKPTGVLMLKLGDADVFRAQLQNLITAYSLPMERGIHGETEILCRADGESPNVCLAVTDRHLFLSNRADTIAAVLDARTEHKTVGDLAFGDKAGRMLSEPAVRVVHLNIAGLARFLLTEEEIPEDEAALLELVRTLADSQARVCAAVTTAPKLLSAQIVLNEAVARPALTLLAESAGASFRQAREQNRRVVSTSNIKGILSSCLIYANEHQGQWPASIGQLAADGSVAVSIFRSPYDGSGPTSIEDVDARSFYLYRPGLNNATLREPSSLVVLGERELRDGRGAYFGFADAHVEWVDEPRASQLLAELRQPQ